MKSSYKGIRELIRQYAGRPGGCSASEIPGLTPSRAGQNAKRMPEVIMVGHRSYRRLFLSEADALAYAAQLPAIKDEARKEKNRRDHVRWKSAQPPKPKPARNPKPAKPQGAVHIPTYTGSKWPKDQPAIIPPHVKVQYIPSPPEFGPAAKLRGIGA